MRVLGQASILRLPIVALICSVQCPGSVVIKTFDAIRELRDAGIVVAGGFHSPMEKECLEFLLRGKQPIVVALARGLGPLRLPPAWRAALEAERLLIVSPFGDDVRRINLNRAEERNNFVATLAGAVLIPHASSQGKTEATANCVIQRGQSLFTFDDEANSRLLALGATRYHLDVVKSAVAPEEAR